MSILGSIMRKSSGKVKYKIPEDMRPILAESAFKLFSEKGVDGASLDEIAKNVGVSKGSLYWHYSSKKDLLLAACNHYYKTYHRKINETIADFTDPVERLEQVLNTAIKSCLLDKANRIFTMEILTLSVHDPDIRRSWQQFYDSVREYYIGLVKNACATKKIKVANPELAVDLMLAAMEGIKLQSIFKPNTCTASEEKIITDGLKKILGFDTKI